MGWRFRKIFRLGGGFRSTLSGKGLGMSWGVPGFRYGISATGRRYINIGIPYTGFYFTKYLSQEPNVPSDNTILQNPKIEEPPLNKPLQSIPWWKQKFFNPKK